MNQKSGFSLVAVLVASAIMAIIAVVFTQYQNTAQRSQTNLRNLTDFEILKHSVQLVLSSPVACHGAFRDGTLNPLTLSVSPTFPINLHQLAAAGTSPLITVGQAMPGNMSVTKIQFTELIYEGPQIVGGANYKQYLAKLHVEANKSASAMSQSALVQDFYVRVLATDPGGSITKCALPFSASGGLMACQEFSAPTVSIGGTSYPLCGMGSGSSSNLPIATVISQKFCEDLGFSSGSPTKAINSSASSNYAYTDGGAWVTHGCSVTMTEIRCCK